MRAVAYLIRTATGDHLVSELPGRMPSDVVVEPLVTASSIVTAIRDIRYETSSADMAIFALKSSALRIARGRS